MLRVLAAIVLLGALPVAAFAQRAGGGPSGPGGANVPAHQPASGATRPSNGSNNNVNPNRRTCGKGSNGSNCRPCQNNNCYPYNYVQGMYVLATPTPSAHHNPPPQNHVTYKQQQNWGGEVFSSIGTNPNPSH